MDPELTIASSVWSQAAASHWNSLAKTPMQRLCWIRACLETVNSGDDVRLITFGNSIAPLVIQRGDPNRLTFIGDTMREPSDVLCDDENLDGLAENVVRTKLPIKLARVPLDAPILGALQRAYQGRGVIGIKPRRFGCPYIELDDTWREPELHLSTSWRAQLRRSRKRAESVGQITFEVVSPKHAQFDSLFEEALAIEATGWKGVQGTAIAVSTWRSAFYKRFAKYAAGEGILRLCFLRIGGQAAAMELAAECNERLFLLRIGYDETFKNCSPGNLLRVESIRYATERGLRSYEFLGSDDTWTYTWTKTVRPMVSLEAYPASARGLWVLAQDKLGVPKSMRKKLDKWTRKVGRQRRGI